MTLRLGFLFLAGLLVACSGSDDGSADSNAALDGLQETDTNSTDTAKETGEPWPWPTCASKAGAGPSLAEKAAYLDALVPGQHLDGTDRLLRTVLLDDEGAVARRYHVPSTGLWTAI
jgi:hypothetical protein